MKIQITIEVYVDVSEITKDELTDIEGAVEATLSEYNQKHDLAVAKIL